MRNIQSVVEELPTTEDVTKVVALGRRGYVAAANEFSALEIVKDPWNKPIAARLSARGLRRAVHVLSDAARADELQPPLPEDLKSVLGQFSDAMREREGEYVHRSTEVQASYATDIFKQSNSVRAAAQLAVTAALDHGAQVNSL